MTEIRKQTPEKTSREPNYKLRRLAALGLIGAMGVVGGAGIVHATSGKSIPKTPDEIALQVDGYVNDDITSLSIAEGARIRSQPSVTEDAAGTTNLLDTTNRAINVKTDNNVVVSHDVNGDWYTIPTASLKRIDPDLHIKGAYVSISGQRATPTKQK